MSDADKNKSDADNNKSDADKNKSRVEDSSFPSEIRKQSLLSTFDKKACKYQIIFSRSK